MAIVLTLEMLFAVWQMPGATKLTAPLIANSL